MNTTTLTDEWKAAKAAVREAQDRLLHIESVIYEQVRLRLPDKGTTTLDSGMKIVTGFTDCWDQREIHSAYQAWPQDAGVPFPFNTEWVPDSKAISYVREHRPDLYSLIRPALTLKPKKPAFSVKE